jgi:hypothetical protein
MGGEAARAPPDPQQPLTLASIDIHHLSTTQIAIGAAGLVVLVGYAIFIFAPSFASYGRLWERFAAGFLSLFILVTLLGIGVAAGIGVIALYVEIASN